MMVPSVRVARVLLAALAATGCRGTIPEQVLAKPTPIVAAAIPEPTSGPWLPRPTGAPTSFAIEQAARVRIEQDSVTREDSVASHTDVSLSIWRGGRFAGSITAFSSSGTGQASVTPRGLMFPLSFSGTISASGVLEVALPAPGATCASPGPSVILSSRDLWLRLPDTLRIGTTWTDSSSTMTCRDGIPLRMNAHRTFRLERSDARDAGVVLLVSRSQRVTLDGAGSQWGEAVRVSGAGAGEMILTLDAGTGVVVEAAGHSTLDLTFMSPRRTQRVHQFAVTNVPPPAKK
jgi:hypothetical protein